METESGTTLQEAAERRGAKLVNESLTRLSAGDKAVEAAVLAGVADIPPTSYHRGVDVARERLQPRMQAWIELYGMLLLVVPFTALVLVFGVPFVVDSFQRSEISPSPGGLPFRWLIKAALVAGFALLALAAVSRIARVVAFLFGAREPTETLGN